MEITKCCLCGDSGVNLYCCENCPAQSDECTNEVQKEHLCDSCITSHVKRGHDVKTLKGQIPLICDAHKTLHSFYCKTCDTTFCTKCYKNHGKHDLGDIEERASELKKEVFEILTEFELGEKPLRALKESIIKQKNCHEVEQNQVKERFIKEIESLREAGLKLLENNGGLFSEKEREVVETIDKVVDMQRKARDILCLDDCMLIQNFEQLLSSAEENRKQSQTVLSEEFEYNSCKVSTIEREFSDFHSKIMLEMTSEITPKIYQGELCRSNKSDTAGSKLECDRVEGVIIEQYASCSARNARGVWEIETNRLIMADSELKLQSVMLEGVHIKCVKENAVFQIGKDVVQAVYFCGGMSYIVQTEDSFFYVFHTFTGDKIRKFKLAPRNGFIAAYAFLDQIHQCYWDANDKAVRFSHDESLFVWCSEPPTLISFKVYPFVCLLTADNKIMLCEFCRIHVYYISLEYHNVPSVNYVNLFNNFGILHLIIWSVKSKSIYIMYSEVEKPLWKLDCVIHWVDPLKFTTPFKLSSVTVQALPAVRKDNVPVKNETDDGIQYVYGIFQADETKWSSLD